MEKMKPQTTGSLARRILEYVGISRAYVRSMGVQEEDSVRIDLPLDYSDLKPVEAALLEAESQRAKAIAQIRRHQIV